MLRTIAIPAPNNGMHPTADTTALMFGNRSGRRVMPGVGLLLVTMKHVIALTLSLLLVFVSFPVSATNARGVSHKVRRGISGRITDLTGTLVVGAKITIVGRSSHAAVVKYSNARGEYAADLDPDTYDVTVAASGFKTVKRTTGIVRGSRSYMDFVLYPGDTGNPIVNP